MVRFLRNTLVAKVAGVESPVLQISTDEKRRVGAIAELYSEEDLARFLQIMLRTHGDVSYKQEQRFHLELGLLKLVHAQRLLPLEQLLSSVRLTDAAAAPARHSAPAQGRTEPRSAAPRTPPPEFTSRPAGVPPVGGGGSPFGKRPSPFEADKARKGREDLSSVAQPAAQTSSVQPMAVTSAPVFPPVGIQNGRVGFDNGSALAVAPQIVPRMEAAAAPADSGTPLDVEAIREAVMTAFESGASQMLVHAMDEGEWSAEGNAVVVKLDMSDGMISVSYTRDQERLANQAAAKVAGRPIKVRLAGGAAPVTEKKPRPVRTGGPDSFKTRAAEEPVVKRMMERFGAEIRIVVDRSEKD
jgi:DNA polymerase-3 subunit gamma/tau